MKGWLAALLLLLLLVLLDLGLWVWSGVRDPLIAEENRLIENAQLVLLALALMLFSARAINSGDIGRRLLYLALALASLSFFVGELHTAGAEARYPILAFVNPPMSRYWLAAAWLGLLLITAVNAAGVWAVVWRWLGTAPAALFLLGCLFYLAAWSVASGLWSIALLSPRLLEELLELNGALLLFFAALWRPRARSPA